MNHNSFLIYLSHGLYRDCVFENFEYPWVTAHSSIHLTVLTHWGWDKMAALFADGTFKCIFLSETVGISIKISLKFVHKGPINNIPALVQIMAWRPPGDKPLSEPMVARLPTHICVTRPQWVTVLIEAFSLILPNINVISLCTVSDMGCHWLLSISSMWPGPWFRIKMPSYQYIRSHCGDKTILQPSYLHNGISYTAKRTSLYWIRAQVYIQ